MIHFCIEKHTKIHREFSNNLVLYVCTYQERAPPKEHGCALTRFLHFSTPTYTHGYPVCVLSCWDQDLNDGWPQGSTFTCFLTLVPFPWVSSVLLGLEYHTGFLQMNPYVWSLVRTLFPHKPNLWLCYLGPAMIPDITKKYESYRENLGTLSQIIFYLVSHYPEGT